MLEAAIASKTASSGPPIGIPEKMRDESSSHGLGENRTRARLAQLPGAGIRMAAEKPQVD